MQISGNILISATDAGGQWDEIGISIDVSDTGDRDSNPFVFEGWESITGGSLAFFKDSDINIVEFGQGDIFMRDGDATAANDFLRFHELDITDTGSFLTFDEFDLRFTDPDGSAITGDRFMQILTDGTYDDFLSSGGMAQFTATIDGQAIQAEVTSVSTTSVPAPSVLFALAAGTVMASKMRSRFGPSILGRGRRAAAPEVEAPAANM